MKKTLLLLVALVATMSMNAQTVKKATVMKVLDGESVLFTQDVKSTIKVVFEKVAITGTATRTGDVEVKWVQLWKNGPKFAEYNVGVTDGKAESYGGYYSWGSSIDKDPSAAYKEGTDALTGTDDTATNLWGNNWRMPTKSELDDLLANCDVVWTNDYKGDGSNIKGCKFTGKVAPYNANSVFLPAAGYCNYGDVGGQGGNGNYWSSTPYESNGAYGLRFDSGNQYAKYENSISRRFFGYSVRAVLKE